MPILRHRATTVSPDIGAAKDAQGTQDVFSQIMRQTQDTSKNIFDDLNAMNTSITGIIYFGNETANGTWRIIATAGNLSVQLRTAGVWVEKFAFTP